MGADVYTNQCDYDQHAPIGEGPTLGQQRRRFKAMLRDKARCLGFPGAGGIAFSPHGRCVAFRIAA
jgi:hypothetical protein